MTLEQVCSFDWNEFRDAVGAWSRRNFGDQDALNPLLGTFEELGELIDVPGRSYDAVADFMIFLADFCARSGLDLQRVVLGNPATDRVLQKPTSDIALSAVGKICHSVLKLRQGIRTNESHEDNLYKALTKLVFWLRSKLPDSSLDGLCNTVVPVWQKVAQRDWNKDKKTGGDLDADGASSTN